MQYNTDKVRKISSEIIVSLMRLGELGALEKSAFLADIQRFLSEFGNYIGLTSEK